MVVTCETCGREYDDTYRLTWCPHDGFDMQTWVHRADGTTRVCTSLEEVAAFLGWNAQQEEPPDAIASA